MSVDKHQEKYEDSHDFGEKKEEEKKEFQLAELEYKQVEGEGDRSLGEHSRRLQEEAYKNVEVKVERRQGKNLRQ